jgi:hypothetical protein
MMPAQHSAAARTPIIWPMKLKRVFVSSQIMVPPFLAWNCFWDRPYTVVVTFMHRTTNRTYRKQEWNTTRDIRTSHYSYPHPRRRTKRQTCRRDEWVMCVCVWENESREAQRKGVMMRWAGISQCVRDLRARWVISMTRARMRWNGWEESCEKPKLY